jgi:uncharacterized RDD family membrane protein YckC
MSTDVIEFERDKEDQAWARWVARNLDFLFLLPITLLIFTAWGAAVELGRLPENSLDWTTNPLLAAAVELVMTFVLLCLWEPLFLSNSGTTPGKWIMGISVRREDGARLSFPVAFLRLIWVWFVGLASGIPFLSLVTMLIARAKLVSDGVTAWDEGLKCRLTHRKRHPVLWAAMIILFIGTNAAFAILNRVMQ